jgi:tetratricopeptide (TPR) repeat protein
LAPDKVQAHHYLAMLLYLKAEQLERSGAQEREKATTLYHESVTQAREALTLKPDYGMAHMVLGLSLKKQGQRSEALLEFQKAVRCNPEHAELHLRVAELLIEENRKNEALGYLEQALRIAPTAGPLRAEIKGKLTELEKAGVKQPAKVTE